MITMAAVVVLTITMAAVLLATETYGQAVILVPRGPLVLERNYEVIINCTVVQGSYSYWEIRYILKAPVSKRVGTIAPGISVTANGINKSSLLLNSSDSTIIGLVCYGSYFKDLVNARINITIIAVTVSPEGPLVLKVNTEITINCTMAIGVTYSFWTVIYDNGSVDGVIGDIVPDVTIFFHGTFLTSVVFHTNDERIIGIACFGSGFEGIIRKRINITMSTLQKGQQHLRTLISM